MSYLLDKKKRRRKFSYILLSVFVLLTLLYFRTSIFNGLASVGHKIFSPVLVAGNNAGGKLAQVKLFFVSKNSLYEENKNLQSELNAVQAMILNYNSLLRENLDLKEVLGRSESTSPRVLASILSKPSQSPYDTLVVDAGTEEGVQEGDMVFALGNLPIGTIAETYPKSSKVILFTSSGERTQVVTPPDNIFLELVGRGGGNFEMTMPRDMKLVKGDQVVLPGISPYVVGVVETVISDPRNPFIKTLLISTVNIQEIKFVQIEKK